MLMLVISNNVILILSFGSVNLFTANLIRPISLAKMVIVIKQEYKRENLQTEQNLSYYIDVDIGCL